MRRQSGQYYRILNHQGSERPYSHQLFAERCLVAEGECLCFSLSFASLHYPEWLSFNRPCCSTMAQNLKSQNSRALGAGRQTDTHRDRNLNGIPEIRVVVRLHRDRNNMQSQRFALLQEIRVHEVRTAGHIERTCFHKRHVVSSWSWRPQLDPRCLLFLKCRTPEGGD